MTRRADVRMTKRMCDRIEEAAKLLGIDPAQWIRDAIQHCLDTELGED